MLSLNAKRCWHACLCGIVVVIQPYNLVRFHLRPSFSLSYYSITPLRPYDARVATINRKRPDTAWMVVGRTSDRAGEILSLTFIALTIRTSGHTVDLMSEMYLADMSREYSLLISAKYILNKF